MLTTLPGGAVALIAVTFIAAMRYVHDDPARSIAWALSGFADTTVWLTFGAFVFALGYRKSGLGRRIALLLVRGLGRRTLGLGYAIALSDLALAPGTPSNTARSGGAIFPIVQQIPPLYGSSPGPTAGRIGTYLMWTAFALADGLNRTGFIAWFAQRAAAPLQGIDPHLATAALLALFFWSHYLFASITSHAVAVLPLLLAVGKGMPGIDAPLLAMLCIYSLGLMGVISPYATGCAPIYAGSGYIGRVRFWLLGAAFGVLYFVVLLIVVWPWLASGSIIRR